MYQLNLPGILRPRRPRHRGSAKKARLFGGNVRLPCVYCELLLTFNEATVEHIVSINKGGPDTIENLAICCAPCNNHRQDYSFDDWKKIAPFDKLVRQLVKANRIVGSYLK